MSERRMPLPIKILLATLAAMSVIAVTNTFANKNREVIIQKDEFEKFSKDAELGLSVLDRLTKQPTPSPAEVEDIKINARDKKFEYLNYQTDNKTALEISMLLSSGFAMIEKSLNDYKGNYDEARQSYEAAQDSFNEVLRLLNKNYMNITE